MGAAQPAIERRVRATRRGQLPHTVGQDRVPVRGAGGAGQLRGQPVPAALRRPPTGRHGRSAAALHPAPRNRRGLPAQPAVPQAARLHQLQRRRPTDAAAGAGRAGRHDPPPDAEERGIPTVGSAVYNDRGRSSRWPKSRRGRSRRRRVSAGRLGEELQGRRRSAPSTRSRSPTWATRRRSPTPGSRSKPSRRAHCDTSSRRRPGSARWWPTS